MKIYLVLIVTTLISTIHSHAQDWGFTYRAPVVSQQLFDKMKAVQIAVVGNAPLITNEWEWSDYLASYYGENTYFAVGVTNSLGGAVLMIPPLVCNESGLASTRISFSDETRGPSHSVNLVREGSIPTNYTLDEDGYINESYLHGVLNLDGQDIHVLVLYYEWPDQPTMLLTWGEGSEVNNFGTTLDLMGDARVIAQPTQSSLSIENYKGSTNFKKGMYLDLTTSWKDYHVEWSTNLTNWATFTNRPYGIDGYVHSFYIGPSTNGVKMFRAQQK